MNEHKYLEMINECISALQKNVIEYNDGQYDSLDDFKRDCWLYIDKVDREEEMQGETY